MTEKLEDRWRRERVAKNRPSDERLREIAKEAENRSNPMTPHGGNPWYDAIEAACIELLEFRRAASEAETQS